MKIETNQKPEGKFKLGMNLRLLVIVLIFFSVVAFAALWRFILQKGTIGHNWGARWYIKQQ